MNASFLRHARCAIAFIGFACAAASTSALGGPVPAPGCCAIGTGPYDLQGSQGAQIPDSSCDPNTTNFAFEAADDFYLCPGKIYKINSITATMATDQLAILQKPQIAIYEDCDGFPGAQVPFNFYVGNPPPPQFDDRPVITVTQGAPYDSSLTLVTVTATFPGLWLRGGKSYWVSFYGTSCFGTTWAWTTAGLGIVQGRPAVARSRTGSPTLSPWMTLDQCCLGCTDLSFCVDAEECKILLDNGTFARPAAGAKSIDNAPITSNLAKAADDFVVPPCDPVDICFIEAYLITNCLNARLDIYEGGCELPASNNPIFTLIPKRYVHTGVFVTVDGLSVEVICLQFWGDTVTLQGGRTYWLSAYGLGTGVPNPRSLFAYNGSCSGLCLQHFSEGALRGPGYNLPNWKHISQVAGFSAHDFAFMVAIHDPTTGAGNATPASCAVDFNRNGVVNIDDLFSFINAWLINCP